MTGSFLIQAGHHYCTPRYPYIFYGSEMSRVVRFDRSCIYKGLPDGKEPVNKVFGFCEVWPSLLRHQWGRPLHHLASARFGWNCDELGQLWLYGYSYADGVRETKRLCIVPPEAPVKCVLRVRGDKYEFKVIAPGNNTLTDYSGSTFFELGTWTKRSAAGSRAFGFGLFPYFGGSGTPDHNMSISLSRT